MNPLGAPPPNDPRTNFNPAAAETNRAAMSALGGSESAELQTQARRGGAWFYWIAALSLVNTLAVVFKWNFSFLAGLGVTQLMDGFAYLALGEFALYGILFIALLAAVVLCGFGYFAGRGSRAAIIVGMVLYALDGGLFLFFGQYLPAAFHAFVLFRLWQGWQAWNKIARLRAESPGFAGPTDPSMRP